MRVSSSLLVPGLVSLAAVAHAGTASVEFVQPQNFTDAGYTRVLPDASDRAEVMRDVERHLRSLAERKLPAGDALRIEVLDIDLAGGFEPTRLRPGDSIRVVRGVSGPRIHLRASLTRGGQVLAAAEDHLSDIGLLRVRPTGDDRLRYEKAMLDAWFDRRFGDH